MAFCEQCGTQLNAGAAFCSNCGKATTLSTTIPSAPLTDASGAAKMPTATAIADDLRRLPEKWQRRFAAIEKAGGERVRWWCWPEAAKLGWKERRLLYSNLWAFVFGPFYYLYLGMWRRAITILVFVVIVDTVLGMAGDALDVPVARLLWVIGAWAYCWAANIDYYRKRVLGRKEWW